MGPSSKKIVVEALAEMIKTLGLAMKLLKGSRFKHWVKTLLGNDDMKAALLRLDKLTAREDSMILSEIYADVKSLRAGQAGVEIIRNLEQKVEEVYNLHVDAQIATWLQAPDPSTNHHLARQLHHAGSGEWFVDSSSFRDWSSCDSSLFWVHGKPGAGKSVFCSTVIDRLKAMSSSVVYFYHDFRDADKKTARGLLAALVLQLGGSSENHLTCLRELYHKHGSLGSGRPGSDMLWSCFEELVTIGLSPVTIVIDALDESLYNERVHILSLIEKMTEHDQMRLFMTSRPEPDIQRRLGRLCSYECNLHELDAQTADMRSYVAHATSNDLPFSGWPRDLVELTVETLASKANGMFRWVFCQLEILKECLPKYVRETLDTLPRTLDETYERILRNIHPSRADDARRVFQRIAFSQHYEVYYKHPHVTVRELAEIFAIDFTSNPSLPKLVAEYRVSDPSTELVRLCSGLIVILPNPQKEVQRDEFDSLVEYDDSDDEHSSHGEHTARPKGNWSAESRCERAGTLSASFFRPQRVPVVNDEYSNEHCNDDSSIVQFAHFSVHEYLLSNHLAADLQVFCINELLAHAEIARMFFACLLSPEYRDIPALSKLEPLELVCSKLPLAATSTLHWTKPLEHPGVVALVEPQLNEFLVLNKDSFEAWHFLKTADYPVSHNSLVGDEYITHHNSHSLMFAASLGLNKHVQQIFFRDQEAKRQGLEAFLLAGQAPHLTTMELLIDMGVNVHDPVPWAYGGGNALIYVCSHDSYSGDNVLEAVEYLLNCGFDITARDRDGRTALHCLISSRPPARSMDIVRLLLTHHADLEARDNAGHSPLHVAVSYGDTSIVSYLLHHGANWQAKDNDGSTVLHTAAVSGNIAVTNLMLPYFDTNVNVVNSHGQTPLHVLVSLGESYNYYSKTGFLDVASVLIKHGADVNLRDATGCTPLHALIRGGKAPYWSGGTGFDVVKLLIAHGVDCNGQDENGWTPLHIACRHQWLGRGWWKGPLIDVLLSHGARPEIQNSDGLTPLALAIEHAGELYSIERLLQAYNGNDILDGALLWKKAETRTRSFDMWAPREDLLRLLYRYGACGPLVKTIELRLSMFTEEDEWRPRF